MGYAVLRWQMAPKEMVVCFDFKTIFEDCACDGGIIMMSTDITWKHGLLLRWKGPSFPIYSDADKSLVIHVNRANFLHLLFITENIIWLWSHVDNKTVYLARVIASKGLFHEEPQTLQCTGAWVCLRTLHGGHGQSWKGEFTFMDLQMKRTLLLLCHMGNDTKQVVDPLGLIRNKKS